MSYQKNSRRGKSRRGKPSDEHSDVHHYDDEQFASIHR